MSEEEDVDYERTLLQLPQVYVFKIPVRKTAGLRYHILFILIHRNQ